MTFSEENVTEGFHSKVRLFSGVIENTTIKQAKLY